MAERLIFPATSSIRTRLLLILVALSVAAALTFTVLAINSLQSNTESAQKISSQSLREQAEGYLVQLTQQGARENDLILNRVAGQALQLADYTAAIYNSSSSLNVEAFWPAEDHMHYGPDRQYVNGLDDVSSVFLPSTGSVNATSLRDIELSAYLDLILPAVYESDPNTVAIYFGTPRDVVRYYPNIDLGSALDHDFQVTGRPWYTGSLEGMDVEMDVYWTPVYEDATGRGLVTTASIPVYDQGRRLVGVIGIDLTLVDIAANVEATQVLESGYSFMIDRQGIAIALPLRGYQDLLGREAQPDELGVDLSRITTGFSPIIEKMLSGETGSESLEIEGRDLFVAYAPLENTGWSLGSVVEARQVLQAVESLQGELEGSARKLTLTRIVPGTVGFFGLMVLLSLIFTNRLTGPIRDLAAAAQKVGAGEFDVALPLDRSDELGSLAQAFNVMASQVRELVAGLEEKVTARTEELQRRAVQLQTAAEISKLAAEMLDPQDLMSQAVDLIRDRFGFYHASVFLLDITGTWADVAASTGEAGRRLLARRHRLAVGSASMIGWATANRLPRVAQDVERDPFHFKNPLLPQTRSELAVPLIVGGRLIGALDVQSTEANAFSEADIRAVEAIAGELAIAIDSARALRVTQTKLDQLEETYRQHVRTSWDRELSKATTTLVRVGPPLPNDAQDTESEETMEMAIRSGRSVVSESGQTVAVPITVRGEVVATVSARRPASGEAWSDDDLAVLEAVTGQAALALENARQHNEEQRRVAELEVLNRVSQAVSQLLRLESLFRVVHQQVNLVLGETDMFFGLYDSDTNLIRFPYVSERGQLVNVAPVPLGQGLTSRVIQSRQPLLLSKDVPEQAKELGAYIIGEISQSWLGVPMLIGDDIIGVIGVQDVENEARFTEDDAALLSTVASQIAAAFQNARLHETTQRAARRERLIHEISSKVRRSPDTKTVLETAARELGRAFSASQASVHLGKPELQISPSDDESDTDGRGEASAGGPQSG